MKLDILCMQVPFGGYKQSGMGKEGGLECIHHYTQLKSVQVATDKAWCPYDWVSTTWSWESQKCTCVYIYVVESADCILHQAAKLQ